MTIEAPRIGALEMTLNGTWWLSSAHQPRCPVTESEAAREVGKKDSLPHGETHLPVKCGKTLK